MDEPAKFDGMVPLLFKPPRRLDARSELLVCVHGIGRDAAQQLDVFSQQAPDTVAVAAPAFSKEFFRRYQQLGHGSAEPRADLALEASLEALGWRTGLSVDRFHLFGFSGGAQFAHRFALLWPGRVRSLHLAAAGYYTRLDRTTPWPLGLADAPSEEQIWAQRRLFLRLPIDVYVGEHDTVRDRALRQSEALDETQGQHRLERAQSWVAHIKKRQRDLTGRKAGLHVLPDCGHDFRAAADPRFGALAARVSSALMRLAAPPEHRPPSTAGRLSIVPDVAQTLRRRSP